MRDDDDGLLTVERRSRSSMTNYDDYGRTIIDHDIL